MNQLEQLNLQWTPTGDGVVDVLRGKPRLARLVLGSGLTDDGVARLREMPMLAASADGDTFLAVSMARTLTDRALAAIGDLHGLAALDLHTSAFGSPHYTARGLAQLRRLPRLAELNVRGEVLTDAALAEIAAIPRLRWLHGQDPVSGDDGFAALGECRTLERLDCRVASRLTDRGYAAVVRLPRLQRLSLGGPRLTDAGIAPLAESTSITDLVPILFGDQAFAYIAQAPRLERLTNMYNRATTDRATRFLRRHPTLVHYSAFGTQITDASLRTLAELPRLETVSLETCDGVTDEGLRALVAARQLRSVSVWSCDRVTGSWLASAPPTMEASSTPGPAGHSAGYRAETLIDYPDMPVPADAVRPSGDLGRAGIEVPVVCFGAQAVVGEDGLRVAAAAGANTRWIGVLTREPFAAPFRLSLRVRPITELRLVLGAHNQHLAFDSRGDVRDTTPWFTQFEEERGEAVALDPAHEIADGQWVDVVVTVGATEQRLVVDGRLRHRWRRAGRRSRAVIGVQRTAVWIRDLRVRAVGEDDEASAGEGPV